MTTGRMNAYDLYMESQKLADCQVLQMYEEIKGKINNHKKYMITHWKRYQTKQLIDENSQILFSITETFGADFEDRLINMLKEDGFNVRVEGKYPATPGSPGPQSSGPYPAFTNYTVSWGSDIPAVQYALDGPKYNENIIT